MNPKLITFILKFNDVENVVRANNASFYLTHFLSSIVRVFIEYLTKRQLMKIFAGPTITNSFLL